MLSLGLCQTVVIAGYILTHDITLLPDSQSQWPLQLYVRKTCSDYSRALSGAVAYSDSLDRTATLRLPAADAIQVNNA